MTFLWLAGGRRGPRRSEPGGLLSQADEGVLSATPDLAVGELAADIVTIGLHIPGRAVVEVVDLQHRIQSAEPVKYTGSPPLSKR